jgi:hypothetical protein
MKNDTKIVMILSLLAMIFVCSYVMVGVSPQKTTGEIVMLQPCGWPWCASYDSHYAQNVNEPNSRANLNNMEGKKYAAEAESIKAQTARENIPLTVFSWIAGSMAALFGIGGVGVIVIIVTLLGHKR